MLSSALVVYHLYLAHSYISDGHGEGSLPDNSMTPEQAAEARRRKKEELERQLAALDEEDRYALHI